MSSLQLIESPAIGNHSIQRCDPRRTVVIDSTIVSFSPTEYKLLLPLLSGQSIKDEDLINEAFGLSVEQWNRDNLSKYIDKLRSKLRPAGLNVLRLTKYGYVLHSL